MADDGPATGRDVLRSAAPAGRLLQRQLLRQHHFPPDAEQAHWP